MNRSIKNAGYAVIGSALFLSIYSCNSSTSGSSSSSDSTATTATTSATTTPVPDTAAPSAANANAATANTNQDFVTTVLKANAKEMVMLQAGIDKGTDKMLKSDAKKMLADHKGLADKLTDYANKNNIALPPVDSSMDMSDMDSKTGKDWDKAWADKMVDGHQKTIAKFEASQNEVTDPALKDLITKTLPTLHKHLDMVQKLQGNMKS
jgi:putative membrane protein